MAAITDLLEGSQRAFCGIDARFTVGQTIQRRFFFADKGRNPIDWTGVDVVCEVIRPSTGAVVLELDASGDADGVLSITKPAAQVPASLATDRAGNSYAWRCIATAGALVIPLWVTTDSTVTFERQ